MKELKIFIGRILLGFINEYQFDRERRAGTFRFKLKKGPRPNKTWTSSIGT